MGSAIDITIDGSCFVTGQTFSRNFPTVNAYNSTHNGGERDVFVAKFSTSGSLLWSTYFGGANDDFGSGIAVSADSSCFITGGTSSRDFPTMNAFDSTYSENTDAFVVKFKIIQQRVTAYILLGIIIGFTIIIPVLVYIYQKRRK